MTERGLRPIGQSKCNFERKTYEKPWQPFAITAADISMSSDVYVSNPNKLKPSHA